MKFFFSCFKLICWTENEKYFSLRVLFYMWNFVLVDIVASSLVGIFFLWMTLSLCLTALGWFISLDPWEIKSPGIADFQLVERNQITLGAQDKIILAKYYVEVSSRGLICYYRAGTVLIVIWWLRMEGDCCFSYSFLRSLPINDSILAFHLMAFAQICINCKMIFGPTTRGLP